MCINMFEYVSIRKPVSLDLIRLFSFTSCSCDSHHSYGSAVVEFIIICHAGLAGLGHADSGGCVIPAGKS